MSNLRRRRRSAANTLDGLVAAGLARVVLPTTDTGWRGYGTGRELLVASTNLTRDPQVTQALGTYWAAAPTDVSITPNTVVPVDFGTGVTTCAKVEFVYDGSHSRVWESEVMAATASQKYTPQERIFVPSLAAGGSVAIAAVVMNGAAEVRTVALGAVSSVNTTAVLYSNTVTVAASGETHIKYRYTMAGGSATFYVSAHKTANLAYLDPYHDGSIAGCSWTGTANQSTSTRPATVLDLGVTGVISDTGFLAMQMRCLFAGADGVSHMMLQVLRSDLSTIFSVQKLSTGYWRFQTNDGSATNLDSYSTPTTFLADTSHTLMLRWVSGSGGSLDMIADGVAEGQQPNSRAPSTATNVYLGGYASTQTSMSQIGCLAMGPVRPSNAQSLVINSLLGQPLSLFSYLKTQGLTGSVVRPLTSDSIGYQVV